MKKFSRIVLLVSSFVFFQNLVAHAASSIGASSMAVSVGSSSGGVAGLAAGNDGKVLNLYTNGSGNLTVNFNFAASSLSSSGLKLNALFMQNTARDVFTFQVKNSSGSFVNLGSTTGNAKAYKSLSFSLPSNSVVNGNVTIRIVSSKNSNNAKIDLLALSGSGGVQPSPTPTVTATPSPSPKPTVTPSPKPSPSPSPSPKPSPIPSPSSSATPPPVSGKVKLPPTGKIVWDWQIGATSESAIQAPAGSKLIDIDGFNATAAEVAELKAQGMYTVCYIDAGSWEPGRPDSAQYPDYLKVYYDKDWGEYFLDVSDVFKPNSVLAELLTARLQMCKDKGFDALEPDNLQNDENAGGKVTLQQQLDFNGWIADKAHELGLAVFQKNGPDKILQKNSQGQMMVDKFDAILNEQCQQYKECDALAEYVKRGKLALDVEYQKTLTLNCSQSNSLVMNAIKKDLGLVGGKDSKYVYQSCE